jgi:ferric-dicitrate binding protein FerR (iron transport regulator)
MFAAAFVGATALIVFAGRVAIPDRNQVPPGEPIAVVEAIDGILPGLQRADVVRVGQWIETGSSLRVALRFGRDSSVRIDRDSRVRALSSNVIELQSGAVYVDTGEDHSRFELRTPLGTARNLGTQFELRLARQALTLRVRTGVVELENHAHAISARPGTEVTLSSLGAETRPIAPDGAEWAWARRVSPPMEMEGVPLATFLARLAREQGWTVEYGDVTLAREAERIILHGSASNLAAREAVEVAIATSGLLHRLEGGSLVVLRADLPRPDDRGSRP